MEVMHLLKEVYNVKKNNKRSRDEILELQKNKLNDLIEHVLKNSKFYREFYGKHGITLENYKTIDYNKYPTIDKEIIIDNFDDLICTKDFNREKLEGFVSHRENWGKKYKGKYTAMTSSGSTGNPTIFVYDQKAWAAVKAFIIGRVDPSHKVKLLKKERIAFIIATGGNFASYNLAQEAKNINYTTLILNVNDDFEEMVKLLKEFQPTILSGYSSSIAALAEEKLSGNLDIYPERVFCSADKLTRNRREIIERAFGVTPLNFYGATESLGMASEDPKTSKLILFDDYYKFEIVDEKMEEVLPGEVGDLIVTNLYNYVMPLLRYRMEDRLKKSKDQNFNFTLIDEIAGRVVDDLYFERGDGSGEKITALQLVGMYFNNVKKIQFVQNDKNTLKIKYVGRGDLEPGKEILSLMIEFFRSKNLEKDVKIITEKVERIPVDPRTGKYRQIIPYKKED
ncbi:MULTISPECIES: phenylacetate--CoA ligase family protein [Psychrilyobacter]|uniref:Phenylacetate--CoA ligase family protein n=1 Tax=Psychrilyobacter piezotolerans TaxID=2293438 RepID=A0ABX9KED5_9FUSO|nr:MULTISPECIES: AMP-binding protein [Psychrilyobacter]MCS5421718.1 phenylacetate--CoA ligase family protein [Psychrilyobacter sp. S5]NDI78883.1 phenylacetate--CoA ligase family protein [Psychrilyobacter piezotolerans]RDE59387.1 phenylacetate--CoA ligase family protein [Psychrilyobacter sp. S5]REI39890.1 phenylacetate--CoA ligase family protein [Psychrilyobacter piezotolerans]